jgi:hypothetical protein
MEMNVKQDAALIRTAIEGDAERIAYDFGKSPEWLWKQANGSYPNFWFINKLWIRAFAINGWHKAELFFNDFDLFRRKLWRDINGLILPFPSEKEKELIEVRNKLDLLLT